MRLLNMILYIYFIDSLRIPHHASHLIPFSVLLYLPFILAASPQKKITMMMIIKNKTKQHKTPFDPLSCLHLHHIFVRVTLGPVIHHTVYPLPKQLCLLMVLAMS